MNESNVTGVVCCDLSGLMLAGMYHQTKHLIIYRNDNCLLF